LDYLQTNIIKDREWLQILGTIAKELNYNNNMISKNNYNQDINIIFIENYTAFYYIN